MPDGYIPATVQEAAFQVTAGNGVVTAGNGVSNSGYRGGQRGGQG